MAPKQFNGKKKHKMTKTDMARIFLSQMERNLPQLAAGPKGEAGPRMQSGAFTTGEDISMEGRGGFAFGGQVGAREASYDASTGEYSYGEEPTDIFGDPTTARGIQEAEFQKRFEIPVPGAPGGCG